MSRKIALALLGCTVLLVPVAVATATGAPVADTTVSQNDADVDTSNATDTGDTSADEPGSATKQVEKVTPLQGTTIAVVGICNPWKPTPAELKKIKLGITVDPADDSGSNSQLTSASLPQAPMKNCFGIDKLTFRAYVPKASLPTLGNIKTKRGPDQGFGTLTEPFWGVSYLEATYLGTKSTVYCAFGDRNHPTPVPFDTGTRQVAGKLFKGKNLDSSGTKATYVAGGFELPDPTAVMGFPKNPDKDDLVVDPNDEDQAVCDWIGWPAGNKRMAIVLPIGLSPPIPYHD